jgi:hypothetical protein
MRKIIYLCYNGNTMASGLTPTYLIPYPLPNDPVDVASDVQDLAVRVENVLLSKSNIAISNTFTATNVFEVNSSNTAVRITQTGSGNAFLVEDSSNPDLTPFIINNVGNVGIGKTAPLEKLDITGNANIDGVLLGGAEARADYLSVGAINKTVSFKSYVTATNTSTITTTTNHGFFPGLLVDIALSPADAVFDGQVEIVTVTPNTFTFLSPSSFPSNISSTASAGSASYPGGYTNPVAVFGTDSDDYAQIAFRNSSSASNASTDFIVYADNGNDYNGWIDMGITSSTFNDPGFTITGPNDGYIFMSAPYGTSGAGNLVLATDGTGTENKIIFAAGGLSTDNTQMEITPDVNVHIEIPTPSTSPSTGALTIVGGVGIQGDLYMAGDLDVSSGGIIARDELYVGADSVSQSQTIGTNIKTASFKARSGTVATITTTVAHGYQPFQKVNIALSPSDPVFDGTDIEILTIPTPNTFTYTVASGTASSSTAGTISAVTGWTNPVAIFTADNPDYSQIVFQNLNSGTAASTDFIAYSDNGNDYSGWIDMGITSSTFSDPEFTITGPNDGYVFMRAPYGTTGAGNLVLATSGYGTENKIVFAAGGLDSDDTQMEITPGVNVHIEIPTPSTSPTTGALTIVGGVGVQGDMNIQGDINIVGDLTFGGGSTTTETLGVTDPAVFVGVNNDADSVDLGLYIEYASSLTPIVRSIDQKSLTSNVATLRTTAVHGFLAGDVVNITGVDATFNGTNLNIIDVPTTTTFTYTKTAANVSATAVSPVGTATVTNRRKYGGIVRDASDGVFKFFTGATTTPTTSVNFSEAGVVFGDLRLNSLDLTVALAATEGGTGFNTYATGDIVYASATNTLSKLAAGTNGHLLTLSSGVPTWAAAPISLPVQTSNAGYLLTTNGTSASWSNTVIANATTTVGLIVKGLTSQTADLFQVQNNSGTSLFEVDSAGNVGIGTVSPIAPLHIAGTSTPMMVFDYYASNVSSSLFLGRKARGTLSSPTAVLSGDSITAVAARGYGATGFPAASSGLVAFFAAENFTDSAQGTYIAFENTPIGSTARAERMRIDAAGNVCIGSIAPAGSLTAQRTYLSVKGTGTTSGTGTGVLQLITNAAGSTNPFPIGSIEWVLPDNTSSSNTRVGLIGMGTEGASANNLGSYMVFYTKANGVSGGSTEAMRIDGVGNVGIGGASTGSKLQVFGSFSAVTKSFDIEHPTKEGMRLRYGSLEGPENGVYVRGTTYQHIIELPEYWTGLVHEDSITVNLTSVGSAQNIYVEKIEDNKVYIGGDLTKAFFTVYGERKDVDKLTVEY